VPHIQALGGDWKGYGMKTEERNWAELQALQQPSYEDPIYDCHELYQEFASLWILDRRYISDNL